MHNPALGDFMQTCDPLQRSRGHKIVTGIQGDINIILSPVAAITLLDYCSCYLEGIWSHLAYLINLKVARWDRGSSSDNGINHAQDSERQLNVMIEKKKLILSLSRSSFMEEQVLPHSLEQSGAGGKSIYLPLSESGMPCFNGFLLG